MTTPADTPAVLVLDDPEWPMPQPGNRAHPSVPRRLRVWQTTTAVYAVVTERGPGMSVTNVAEHVHAALLANYGPRLRVFEHYPADSFQVEHFDEITVAATGRPAWRRASREAMVALLGPQVLDDMPDLPPDPHPSDELDADGPPRLAPPDGLGPADSTVLAGYPQPGAGLVVMQTAGGDLIGPLPHYVKHAPDGLAWGYHGSGPAELARCLLITVLGEAARCDVCAGTGQLAAEPAEGDDRDFQDHDAGAAPEEEDTARCRNCEDGITLPSDLYQAFKADVVANWPQEAEWRITAGEIRAWLRSHASYSSNE